MPVSVQGGKLCALDVRLTWADNKYTLFGSTLLISESSVSCIFECLVTRLPVEFSAELKGSEIRRQLVF